MPKHAARGTTSTVRARLLAGAAAALTGAVLASAFPSTASARPSHAATPVSSIRTTALFNYGAGEIPENVSVAADGSAVVSLIGSCAVCQRTQAPQLVRISASGQRTVLATGRIGEAITGNALGRDGTIYFSVWAPGNVERNGVYARGVDGSARRIAALPANAGPNGLAIDRRAGTLYVADSFQATIWAVPVSGGDVRPWLSDAALAPVPTEALPIGANGLKFQNGALWVSNFNQGTLLRIAVRRAGAAGRIRVVTSGIPNIDDFSFLSARVDVAFVTQNGSSSLNGPDRVLAVFPDGAVKPLLSTADGLASPSATAVRGNRLYITNGGVPEPHHATLQVATIDLAALVGGSHRAASKR